MPTKYKGNKKETSALNALINLMRCTNSLSSRINKTCLDSDLTESQFGVLEALYHLGSLNQKKLAEKLLVSPGNITMVIDNLERRDLVKRERSKEDRRYININLTNKGNNLIKKILPTHIKSIVNEFSCLSLSEQDQLRDICRKLGKKHKS